MFPTFGDGVNRSFTTKRNLKCNTSKLLFAVILTLLLMTSSQSAAQEDFTISSPSGTTSESTDGTRSWKFDEQKDTRATLLRNNPEAIIWDHHCSRKTIRYWSSSFPVIFSCVPTSLLNATGSYGAIDDSFEQTYKFRSRPTRAPKRALVNASLQFEVPMGVTDLRLWYQDIVSIEDNAFFKMREMKLLNLQHNGISYISQQAFADLSALEELDLSYNRLTGIDGAVFENLRTLIRLNLRFNEISHVGNSMFCGLDQLSLLDLSYNRIQDIGQYALRHFRSSYALTIDLTKNRLKTPKYEWLKVGPNYKNDPYCNEKTSEAVISEGKIPRTASSLRTPTNLSGIVITNENKDRSVSVNSNHNEYESPRVIVFRASRNPWSCTCDSGLKLLQFIRQYQSIHNIQTSLNGEAETSINSSVVRNVRRVNWYFNMPCSDTEFKGVDIGRLVKDHLLDIEESCCRLEPGVIARDKPLGQICGANKTRNDEIMDNNVTIIGIFIVFVTPILLTLCPDCNRSVAPSSGSKNVVSSGKFGTVSLNANNNKCLDRYPNYKTQDSERFCLVLQEENVPPKRIYLAHKV